MADGDLDRFRLWLQIDEHNLDEMLVKQPSLYHEICDRHARAVSRRDKLKEGLKVVGAELNLSVKEEADKKRKKMTEHTASAAVLSKKEHKDATKAFRKACLRVDRLQALRDAFQQRAFVLRDLVALFLSTYYSEHSVDGNSVKGVKQARYEKIRRNLAKDRAQ